MGVSNPYTFKLDQNYNVNANIVQDSYLSGSVTIKLAKFQIKETVGAGYNVFEYGWGYSSEPTKYTDYTGSITSSSLKFINPVASLNYLYLHTTMYGHTGSVDTGRITADVKLVDNSSENRKNFLVGKSIKVSNGSNYALVIYYLNDWNVFSMRTEDHGLSGWCVNNFRVGSTYTFNLELK